MKAATASFIASLLLLGLAVVIGGGGHGIVSALAVACSPLPLALGFRVLFLAPIFWALTIATTIKGPRWLFPALISAHYAIGAIELFRTVPEDPWTNRNILHAFGPLIATWVVAYVAWQVILWFAYVHYRKPSWRPSEHKAISSP